MRALQVEQEQPLKSSLLECTGGGFPEVWFLVRRVVAQAPLTRRTALRRFHLVQAPERGEQIERMRAVRADDLVARRRPCPRAAMLDRQLLRTRDLAGCRQG